MNEPRDNDLLAAERPFIDDSDLPEPEYLSGSEKNAIRSFFPDKAYVALRPGPASGLSRARIYVAYPDKDAPCLVKLTSHVDAHQEHQAYKQFIDKRLPNHSARIFSEPQRIAGSDFSVLVYSFIDQLKKETRGSLPDLSFATYYKTHTLAELKTVLDEVLQALAKGFYQTGEVSKRNVRYRRYYDHLLPVHLVLTETSADAAVTLVLRGNSPQNLIEEKLHRQVHSLALGATIQVSDFLITHIEVDAATQSQTLTLKSHLPLPDASEYTATAPLRCKLQMQQRGDYHIGDRFSTSAARVVEKRDDELQRLVASLTDATAYQFDATADTITIAGRSYSNPLGHVEDLLRRDYEPKLALVHGDLNLQNILVTPESRHPWLIDFADTRRAPTPYDLQFLEMQIITLILPGEMAKARLSPHHLVKLLQTLHDDPAAPTPIAKLEKPYTCLALLRRQAMSANYYFHQRNHWEEEYYPGLILALLGALRFSNLTATGRIFALIAASTLLCWTPLKVCPPDIPRPWWKKGTLVWLLSLVLVAGMGVWLFQAPLQAFVNSLMAGPSAPNTRLATPTTASGAAVLGEVNTPTLAADSPTPTTPPTPTPTATPAPTPTASPTATVLPTATPSATLPPTAEAPLPPYPTTAADVVALLRNQGYLRVGVRHDTPPFGYDPAWQTCDYHQGYNENFQPTGFDIDLAREFAQRWLGDATKVQLICVAAGDRITATQERAFDLLAAALGYRDDRCQAILCSERYLEDSLGLLVRQDSGITYLAQLEGKTYSALAGTTAIGEVGIELRNYGITITHQIFESREAAIAAVISGTVAAYITDYSILKGWLDTHPQDAAILNIADKGFGKELFTVGIPPQRPGMQELLLLTLQAMKSDGTYDQIFTQWLGAKYAPYPIPTPAGPLPAVVLRADLPAPIPTPTVATMPTPTIRDVEAGDSLYEIARQVYGNGAWYPCIAQASDIANASVIRVGDSLTIPSLAECSQMIE